MLDKVLIIAITLIALTMTGSYTFYAYSELKSLERNVESAIVKGIDPITVRCAYSRSIDTICIAYGTSIKNAPSLVVPPSVKK